MNKPKKIILTGTIVGCVYTGLNFGMGYVFKKSFQKNKDKFFQTVEHNLVTAISSKNNNPNFDAKQLHKLINQELDYSFQYSQGIFNSKITTYIKPKNNPKNIINITSNIKHGPIFGNLDVGFGKAHTDCSIYVPYDKSNPSPDLNRDYQIILPTITTLIKPGSIYSYIKHGELKAGNRNNIAIKASDIKLSIYTDLKSEKEFKLDIDHINISNLIYTDLLKQFGGKQPIPIANNYIVKKFNIESSFENDSSDKTTSKFTLNIDKVSNDRKETKEHSLLPRPEYDKIIAKHTYNQSPEQLNRLIDYYLKVTDRLLKIKISDLELDFVSQPIENKKLNQEMEIEFKFDDAHIMGTDFNPVNPGKDEVKILARYNPQIINELEKLSDYNQSLKFILSNMESKIILPKATTDRFIKDSLKSKLTLVDYLKDFNCLTNDYENDKYIISINDLLKNDKSKVITPP